MYRDNEKGIALIMVLIMLAVVGVLTAMLLSSARTHSNLARHEESMSKAFHSAEAGVEFVRAGLYSGELDLNSAETGKFIDENHSFSDEEIWLKENTFDKIELENVKFKVEVENNVGTIELLSTGEYERYNEEILLVFTFGGDRNFIGFTEENEVYNFGVDDIPHFDNVSLGKVKHGNNEHDGELTGSTWNSQENKIIVSGKRFGSGGGHGQFNLYETNLKAELDWGGNDVKNSHLDDIIWIEDNKYYAVTHQGILYEKTSSGWDEILKQNDWDQFFMPSNTRHKQLAYGESNNVLIMVEKGGNVFYYDEVNSDSGRISDIYDDMYDVAYGNGKFVAVGHDNSWGEIYYSDTGKSGDWVSTNPPSWEYKAVTWTGERFVATGDSGQIAISDDGKDWKEPARVTFPYTRSLNNVAGSGNVVIASSRDPGPHGEEYGGSIIVSLDGGNNWDGYDGSQYENIPVFREIITVGDGVSEPILSSWEQQ